MRKIDPEKLKTLLTSLAEKEISEGHFFGIEYRVLQNGEPVLHEAFGSRSSEGEPLPKGLIYRGCSMTKPVYTAAVLKLVGEGRIGLQDPLSDYFPEWKEAALCPEAGGGRAAGPVRVFHLLCHTSGVLSGPQKPYRSLTELAEDLASVPLEFEPFTQNRYNTVAFDVAGAVVEKVTGIPFADFLDDCFFRPLGMPDSTVRPTEEQRGRMIPMHNLGEDGKPYNFKLKHDYEYTGTEMACSAFCGGVVTTAADYSRFAEMLRLGGVAPDGTRLLTEEAVRLMRTPQVPESLMPGPERWGLGVRVITDPGYPFGLPVGTFGWSGAYGTHFWVDPVNGITAVMMKNSAYDGGAGNRSACAFEETVSASLV